MNLVIIGFMGTGKSALGRALAEELGYEFIDADQLIEADYGKKITQIFQEEGEAFFRELENKLAQQLSRADRKVIATGGGWVLNPENLRLGRINGFIISLTAPPENIYERTKHETHRPLLVCSDPLAEITRILTGRESLYQAADLVVDTSRETPEELSKQIIKELMRRGIVDGRG